MWHFIFIYISLSLSIYLCVSVDCYIRAYFLVVVNFVHNFFDLCCVYPTSAAFLLNFLQVNVMFNRSSRVIRLIDIFGYPWASSKRSISQLLCIHRKHSVKRHTDRRSQKTSRSAVMHINILRYWFGAWASTNYNFTKHYDRDWIGLSSIKIKW